MAHQEIDPHPDHVVYGGQIPFGKYKQIYFLADCRYRRLEEVFTTLPIKPNFLFSNKINFLNATEIIWKYFKSYLNNIHESKLFVVLFGNNEFVEKIPCKECRGHDSCKVFKIKNARREPAVKCVFERALNFKTSINDTYGANSDVFFCDVFPIHIENYQKHAVTDHNNIIGHIRKMIVPNAKEQTKQLIGELLLYNQHIKKANLHCIDNCGSWFIHINEENPDLLYYMNAMADIIDSNDYSFSENHCQQLAGSLSYLLLEYNDVKMNSFPLETSIQNSVSNSYGQNTNNSRNKLHLVNNLHNGEQINPYKLLIVGDMWLNDIKNNWPVDSKNNVTFEIHDGIDISTISTILSSKYPDLSSTFLLLTFNRKDIVEYLPDSTCVNHPSILYPKFRSMLLSPTFLQNKFPLIMNSITTKISEELKVMKVGYLNVKFTVTDYLSSIINRHYYKFNHSISMGSVNFPIEENKMISILTEFKKWIAMFNAGNELPGFTSQIEIKAKLSPQPDCFVEETVISPDKTASVLDYYSTQILDSIRKKERGNSLQDNFANAGNSHQTNMGSNSPPGPSTLCQRRSESWYDDSSRREGTNSQDSKRRERSQDSRRRERSRSKDSRRRQRSRSRDSRRRGRSRSQDSRRRERSTSQESDWRRKRTHLQDSPKRDQNGRKAISSDHKRVSTDESLLNEEQKMMLQQLKTEHKMEYLNYMENPLSYPKYETMRQEFIKKKISQGSGISLKIILKEWDNEWSSKLEENFQKQWSKKKEYFIQKVRNTESVEEKCPPNHTNINVPPDNDEIVGKFVHDDQPNDEGVVEVICAIMQMSIPLPAVINKHLAELSEKIYLGMSQNITPGRNFSFQDLAMLEEIIATISSIKDTQSAVQSALLGGMVEKLNCLKIDAMKFKMNNEENESTKSQRIIPPQSFVSNQHMNPTNPSHNIPNAFPDQSNQHMDMYSNAIDNMQNNYFANVQSNINAQQGNYYNNTPCVAYPALTNTTKNYCETVKQFTPVVSPLTKSPPNEEIPTQSSSRRGSSNYKKSKSKSEVSYTTKRKPLYKEKSPERKESILDLRDRIIRNRRLEKKRRDAIKPPVHRGFVRSEIEMEKDESKTNRAYEAVPPPSSLY